MKASLLTCCALACAACADGIVDLGGNYQAERVVVVDIPPDINNELDLLFVVDNSETMEAKQIALSSSFDRLISHLRFADGGLPSLHIGVVSTDLGVGFNDVAGCSIAGDRGSLQSRARVPGCATPKESFMSQVTYEDSATDKNFEGGITEAFACISQLGTNGCRFEQPLEAMRLAIEQDDDDGTGFLRGNAALAVVLLTDEDDCSVMDNGMFDPSLDPMSIVSKFRCFQHGVECKGDDVFQPGEREGCQPKPDSLYMDHVDEYVEFLKDKKWDPRKVVVTGMMGDPSLVNVQLDLDERPQVLPSCSDESGDAYPAIRLKHFVDGFGETAHTSSICGSEPFSALTNTAKRIRKTLGTRCLDLYLTDSQPETPGRQPDCVVSDIYPDASRRQIPACTNEYEPEKSASFPCYTLRAGPAACGDFPTQLALNVCRGPNISPSCVSDPQPMGTRTIAECLVYDPNSE